MRDLIDQTITAVCGAAGVDRHELSSRRRARHIVEARQMVYLVLREESPLTLRELGARFGYRHPSVLYGIGAMRDKIANEAGLRGVYQRVKAEVHGG